MDVNSHGKTKSFPSFCLIYNRSIPTLWYPESTLFWFPSLMISFACFELCMNEIIQYVLFCVWLLSHNIVSVRVIHVFCISVVHSFLSLSNIPLYKYINLLSILVDGHLDISSFMSKAIMDILVKAFLWTSFFCLSWVNAFEWIWWVMGQV